MFILMNDGKTFFMFAQKQDNRILIDWFRASGTTIRNEKNKNNSRSYYFLVDEAI